MKLEEYKCRRPIAAELNKLGVWLPFPNVSFLLGTDAYRGRPDGEYRHPEGKVVDVEFKAASGSLYLGNEEDPSETEGFHFSQREWHRHISARSKVPYLLVVYAYPDKSDKRMKAGKGAFYVVTPLIWQELEKLIYAVDPARNKRTVSIASGSDRLLAYRHISLEDMWAQHRYATAGEAALAIHERTT